MHKISIHGPTAILKWGYRSVATVGPWTITVDPAGGTVTGTIVTADTFALTQPALTFCVVRPTSTWEWPVESLQIAGTALTARLGPQKD